jgi:hypothetical protein
MLSMWALMAATLIPVDVTDVADENLILNFKNTADDCVGDGWQI